MTFLGWLSDLLERLSDLQLGDEKVTLNHLVLVRSSGCRQFIMVYQGLLQSLYVLGSKLVILGMVIPHLIGNPGILIMSL